MGRLTLRNFRSLVSKALTKFDLANDPIDLYVLLAQNEVATARDLEHDLRVAELITVPGRSEYPIPFDDELLGITGLSDLSSGSQLIRSGFNNLRRNYARGEGGVPRYWTKKGSSIFIWPVPTGRRVLEVAAAAVPPVMEDDDDTSGLSAIYDNAIYLLAVSYALSANDKDEDSERWFTRAIAYLRSRADVTDFESQSISSPISVARSLEDLTRIEGNRGTY